MLAPDNFLMTPALTFFPRIDIIKLFFIYFVVHHRSRTKSFMKIMDFCEN